VEVSDCIRVDDVSGEAYTAAVGRWKENVIYKGLQHQYSEIVFEFSYFRYHIVGNTVPVP